MVVGLRFHRGLLGSITALALSACAAGGPAPLAAPSPPAGSDTPPAAATGAPTGADQQTQISLDSNHALNGDAAPPAPGADVVVTAADGKPRLWAVRAFARVLQAPDSKASLIGLVRAGQGVPLATGSRLTRSGLGQCSGGWYEVLPRGVVCLNEFSTLDARDPRVAAAQLSLPDASKDLPFHVGTSIGAPLYARIPSRAEQEANEPGLAAHLAKIPAADDALGGTIDATPSGVAPPPALLRYIRESKPRLLADEAAYTGRRIAWTREFDAEGRTWLLTGDMGLVPKDKVRTRSSSELAGIDLRGEGAPRLPLAYAWLGEIKKYKRDPSGVLIETGEVWPRQAFFELTTQSSKGPGGFYWKTKDDHYVRNDMVSVIKTKGGRPAGVKKTDKWLHVRVTWGYMVAYEGDTPVFATAISPGMDGITERAQGHTTRRGIYPVGWKLLSADMSGVDKGKEWAVDEVPFVGYYRDSYAVHGAYWHDDFGRPKSHGCVNMAPRDARWLFNWMDPALPEGWYAVAATPGMKVPFTWIDVRP